MTAAELLHGLRERSALIWRDGERLHVDVPTELVTPELHGQIKRHKPEILALLDQEAAEVPLVQTEVIVRSAAGVEIIKLTPLNPPGPTRWEKRWSSKGVCSLIGDSTTDPATVACWIDVLRGLPGTVLDP